MLPRKHLLTLLTVPLLAAPLSALADPTYSATLLPAGFRAAGLGTHGEVVGTIETANGYVASIWTNGMVTTYGTLGGSNSWFSAISSNGLLTGASDTVGNKAVHAFIYEYGAMRDIGTTAPGWTRGYGINSAGQVVGSIEPDPGRSDRAFVYSNGVLMDIGTFGGKDSRATDINDSGVVVGFALDAKGRGGLGAAHPFVYSNGVMTDLGLMVPQADEGGASAINNAGDIVGTISSHFGLASHAFLYSDGAMHDLGSLGGGYSSAADINDLGQVVGITTLAQDRTSDTIRAYLYQNGTMQDLNTMVSGIDGWHLSSAYAINGSGQILVFGCTSGAPCQSVLLNPIAAIPEPATWVMLLAGLGGLVWRRRGGLAATVPA